MIYRGRPLRGPLDLTHVDFLRLTGDERGEMLTLIYLGVDNPMIARYHAEVERVGNTDAPPGHPFRLRDLGSGNPTFVNDELEYAFDGYLTPRCQLP